MTIAAGEEKRVRMALEAAAEAVEALDGSRVVTPRPISVLAAGGAAAEARRICLGLPPARRKAPLPADFDASPPPTERAIAKADAEFFGRAPAWRPSAQAPRYGRWSPAPA